MYMNNNMYNYIPNHANYNNEYVEEYLKNNLGNKMKVHVSFPDSIEWRDSVFEGILKQVGKDYIVIENIIIWCIYIDYIILS